MATRLFRNSAFLLLSFLVLFIFSAHAAGAINTISQGNTIFIGEQGLNLVPAVTQAQAAAGSTSTSIGWWASAADVLATSPTARIDVGPSMSAFTVSPSDFGGRTGNWYLVNTTSGLAAQAGGNPVFVISVADPQLAIKAFDPVIPGDRTNDWVPTGDPVYFEIDSNLYAANQRGTGGAPVTIHVQAPGGSEFSQLSGSTRSLIDVPITTNPFQTNTVGIIWNTGDPLYTQGTYTIWAECTLNGMKDNYPVTGKSISSRITILNQDVNPLIKTYTGIPTRTTAIPTSTIIPTTTVAPVKTATSAAVTKTTEITLLPTVSSTVQTTLPGVVTQETLPEVTKAPGFDLVVALTALVFGFAAVRKKQ